MKHAGPSQRQLRVGEQVRHALASIFQRGAIMDPMLSGIVLTVTEVRMSADLKRSEERRVGKECRSRG